jgi:hypothetical protein
MRLAIVAKQADARSLKPLCIIYLNDMNGRNKTTAPPGSNKVSRGVIKPVSHSRLL